MRRDAARRLAQTIIDSGEESRTFEVSFFDMQEARVVAEAFLELGCAVSFEDLSKPFLIVDQAVVQIDE